MTPKEAISEIHKRICSEGQNRENTTCHFCDDSCLYDEFACPISVAMLALKEKKYDTDDLNEVSKMCFQASIKSKSDAETAHECNLNTLEAFYYGQQYAYHQMAKWIEGYKLNRGRKEE